MRIKIGLIINSVCRSVAFLSLLVLVSCGGINKSDVKEEQEHAADSVRTEELEQDMIDTLKMAEKHFEADSIAKAKADSKVDPTDK